MLACCFKLKIPSLQLLVFNGERKHGREREIMEKENMALGEKSCIVSKCYLLMGIDMKLDIHCLLEMGLM